MTPIESAAARLDELINAERLAGLQLATLVRVLVERDLLPYPLKLFAQAKLQAYDVALSAWAAHVKITSLQFNIQPGATDDEKHS
jgi:hypothetical protein